MRTGSALMARAMASLYRLANLPSFAGSSHVRGGRVQEHTVCFGNIEVDGVAQACELPDFDIWPISTRLARKYIGANSPFGSAEKFVENMKTEPRLLFRLEPEVWRAIDLTVYRGKRSDREHQAAQREGQG